MDTNTTPSAGQTWRVATGPCTDYNAIMLRKADTVRMLVGGVCEEWHAVQLDNNGAVVGLCRFRPNSIGIGSGKPTAAEIIQPAALADLEAQACQAEQAARQAIQAAAAKRDADRTRARAQAAAMRPAWAQAAIVAEIIVDDSDMQTDYFGEHTERTYLLGWSRTTRENFAELRKAAAACRIADQFPALHPGRGVFRVCAVLCQDLPDRGYWKGNKSHWHTEHTPELPFHTLAAAQEWIEAHPAPHAITFDSVMVDFAWHITETKTEHREKYSGGKGYYLQVGAWRIRKAHDGAEMAMMHEDGDATPPTTAAETVTPAHAEGALTITENTEKNGIEIRFPSKPAATILERLKAAGWRWSKFSACWYTKATTEARAFAATL
jgi:hypothetical protein